MSGIALVTGATGCLGSALTAELVARDGRVAVLVRPGESLGDIGRLADRLDIRFGDVTEPASLAAAMRDVGRVYHLAGVVVPLNKASDLMWRVNAIGSYNVARAALQAGVDRMVHVSSIAAIGYPPDGTIATETFDPADSVASNAYSTTKRCAERLVTELGPAGLDVVVVNPSAVFARGGDPRYAWSRLVDTARKGLLRAMPGGGTAVCAERDFVDGAIKAMDHGIGGQRYILSSANLTYQEIGEGILHAVGRTPVIRRQLPTTALRVAARFNRRIAAVHPNPVKSSLLVPENVELMTRSLYYDQGKAVSGLGLTQTPLEEMFRDLAGAAPLAGVTP